MANHAAANDLALLPATELVARYQQRSLSPVEAVQAALGRIESRDGVLNAFRLVNAEGALAAARESEGRWQRGEPLSPLDGVPASIKDILLTRGWATLRGSRTVDPGQGWEEDAPAVARLREAGAVLVGKTTTPEFGWKGVTDSPLTGITRNPWDPAMTPGGSSGGAAVAAASGMAALNIGTDGGGSIRIPASFTGVFGFKPSFGRVPAYPLSPFGSIAHLGPLTRTVADAALMLQVIARPDPRDWTAPPLPVPDYLAALDGGIRGLRVAYVPTLSDAAVDPEVTGAVRRAAETLGELGAIVEERTLPLTDLADVFFKHWTVAAATLVARIPEARHGEMDPGLLAIAAAGGAVPLLAYTEAALARGRMGLAMNLFHQAVDLVVIPTMPITAFAAGHDAPPEGPYRGWQDWTPFTYPFNLTQQPAASVPCGRSAAGLPIGVQLIGGLHRDEVVLRAARALERAMPWELPA